MVVAGRKGSAPARRLGPGRKPKFNQRYGEHEPSSKGFHLLHLLHLQTKISQRIPTGVDLYLANSEAIFSSRGMRLFMCAGRLIKSLSINLAETLERCAAAKAASRFDRFIGRSWLSLEAPGFALVQGILHL